MRGGSWRGGRVKGVFQDEDEASCLTLRRMVQQRGENGGVVSGRQRGIQESGTSRSQAEESLDGNTEGSDLGRGEKAELVALVLEVLRGFFWLLLSLL